MPPERKAHLSPASAHTQISLRVMTGPFGLEEMEPRSSSLPDVWQEPLGLHSISAIRPLGSAARLSIRKAVVPLETLYLEIIQLGIVNDLSVQRPDGQVGTAGMSRAEAVAANAAVARSTALILVGRRLRDSRVIGHQLQGWLRGVHYEGYNSTEVRYSCIYIRDT
jgi:hypothetical protein